MKHFRTEDTFLMIRSPIDGSLKHIPTKIFYAFAPECDAPDFDYGNELENARELNRFRSGELSNVCLKVTASALGENGYDSLGQCFVVSRKCEEQLLETAIEHDMKNNACRELQGNILCQWSAMSQAFGSKEAVNA